MSPVLCPQACNTDMFSGFCHSRHRGTERGEFEVLAAKVERGRKKGIMMSIFESSITTHQLKYVECVYSVMVCSGMVCSGMVCSGMVCRCDVCSVMVCRCDGVQCDGV